MPDTTIRPPVVAVLAAVPLAIEAGETTWIQVLKTGSFTDQRYGDFSVTVEDMATMVANFHRLNRPVPGDYDHSFTQGEGSRACGWTRGLEIRGGELWAEVEFTPTAAAQIRSGEYRFISPEFSFAYMNERGENIGPALMAWALTNRPFLEGMAEVTLAVAGDGRTLWCAESTTKERSMDPKELRKRLGLGEDATDEQVLARAGELVTLAQPRPDAVILTHADHQTLVARADAGDQAVRELHNQKRDVLLDQAIRDGKIPPAMRPSLALAYDADPAGVTSTLDGMDKNPALHTIGLNADQAHTQHTDDQGQPIGQRLETRALALMQATPGLGYEDALIRADRELRPQGVK